MMVNSRVCCGHLEVDGGGEAKAEHCLRWHIPGADFIAIQPEHPDLGEVGHVHYPAEAAQREFWKVGEEMLDKSIWAVYLLKSM